MSIYIKGSFLQHIFKANDSYVIGLFKVREIDTAYHDYLNKTITFTGYFHELNEEDTYILHGHFKEHPRYGNQFQVTDYERSKPSDKETLISFLTSGLFKGIGLKTATKIVDTLGLNCLELIMEDYTNLLKVPAMTDKKALQIYNLLQKYEESYTTIAYLLELGFITKEALLIYNKYQADTKKILADNIYQLIFDFDYFSFIKIDNLKKRLKIENNDERRLKAAIVYTIEQICNNIGHTYLLEEEIINNSIKYLGIEIAYDELIDNLKALVLEDKIVEENKRYYLKKIFMAEQDSASFLANLSMKHTNLKQLDKYIKEVEKSFKLSFNEKQKEAMKKSLTNNLVIITGGPGTGKTTIIKGIVELYKIVNHLDLKELLDDVILLAPTGRAAKRISEQTSLPAHTIHRFLKWNKENNTFAVNEHNKAKVKFVIIDEVSMIDTMLLANLCKGLKNNIKLVLVGDANQLPSIGTGQILKDLIDSDLLDVINLKTLYRQEMDSTIISLAFDVNSGNLELDYLKSKEDCKLIECSASSLLANIQLICEDLFKEHKKVNQIQVLAPIYKGQHGIDNLNKLLQTIFNPRSPLKKELAIGDIVYREQDKVLQLVNLIDDNVFNGDIGVIEKILTKEKEIHINFDDHLIKYKTSDLNDIRHGYAISVHKAQGSEFDYIILPMSYSYDRMLFRKLIYTAVTRAKQKLFIIGEKEAFLKGIMNNKTNIRQTTLKEMITKLILGNQYKI